MIDRFLNVEKGRTTMVHGYGQPPAGGDTANKPDNNLVQPPAFPATNQKTANNNQYIAPPNPFPTNRKKQKKHSRKILIAIILCCVLVFGIGITAGVMVYQHNRQVAAQIAEKKRKAREAKKRAEEKAEEEAEKEAEEEQEAQDAKLSLAYKACDSKNSTEKLELADEDKTLTYSAGPDASVDKMDCVITFLQMPQATIAKMNATTGLSGMQQDSWDNIDVTWSYNGNIGLHAVFQIDNDDD